MYFVMPACDVHSEVDVISACDNIGVDLFSNFEFERVNLLNMKTLNILQDIHSRYRTEAHQDIVGRFNER